MSFTITPPNSSPLGSKKRGREDDDHVDSKRWQDTKIHTEVHHNTIQMMLQAQRELQQRENTEPELYISSEVESEETSTYTQSPFWPVLNRVRK